MMETMIPPQVEMRLRTKNKKIYKKRGQRSPNKKRPYKKERKGPNKKMREKERRGNVTILLPHLCFRVAPCSPYRESLLSYHFHILVGIFIIELGLYIPMMGFLKCPRSS